MNPAFHLPIWFDLGATFAFALTGALAAIRRGYDIVGIFFLALVSSIGGGLIRDGVFIPSASPMPLLTDPRYIELRRSPTAFRGGCPRRRCEPRVLPSLSTYAWSASALPLLVAGVVADDDDTPVPADHFALLTHRLDAGSNLHVVVLVSYRPVP